MSAATELWINFGVNMLLKRPFADVPAAHANRISMVAADELGIMVRIRTGKRSTARLYRTGVRR